LNKAERDNAERDAGRRQVDRWARDLRGVGPRHYFYVGPHSPAEPSAEDLTDVLFALPGLEPSKK
jgi:hypothetical protein